MNSRNLLVFLITASALVAGLAGGYWYASSKFGDDRLMPAEPAIKPDSVTVV